MKITRIRTEDLSESMIHKGEYICLMDKDPQRPTVSISYGRAPQVWEGPRMAVHVFGSSSLGVHEPILKIFGNTERFCVLEVTEGELEGWRGYYWEQI